MDSVIFRSFCLCDIKENTFHLSKKQTLMLSNIIRPFRYILPIFILILITQSIRNTVFLSNYNQTYNTEIHRFVPMDLHSIVQESSAVYTINDLLNITNSSKNFQEFKLNSSNNSIHLISQWYYETNLRRRNELVSVLHMNVINDAITHIHFIQNSNISTIFNDIKIDKQFPLDLLKSKLIIYYDKNTDENQRLTINQALQYANRFINNGYSVLFNLDIFFDQSLLILKHRPLLNKNTILYLSRYEVDPSITTLGLQCSNEHYVGSHDVLIFQTPLLENVISKFPFELGTWHIEVKIIYEFLKANYSVRNSCKSIKPWHLHSSQIRHRLMPSKKYISDSLLGRIRRYPEFL